MASWSHLREEAGTRDRDLDLLGFEIEEIEALGPSEAEREALDGRERERLRQMDGLLAAAGGGAEAIAPAGRRGGRGELLAEAERMAGASRC